MMSTTSDHFVGAVRDHLRPRRRRLQGHGHEVRMSKRVRDLLTLHPRDGFRG